MSIIIKAPTFANSKSQIEQKYKLLVEELHNHLLDKVEVIHSYFPIRALLQKHELIFVRDSVSLIPFYILIHLLNICCVIEINGDPIHDSNLPKVIKLILTKWKKYLLKQKNIFLVFYSPDEAVKFGAKNYIVLNNYTNVDCVKYETPRPKTFLMLIGSDFSWHGVERVFQLAEMLPFCDFHIYGLKKSLNISCSNLFFHPPSDIDTIQKNTKYGYAIGSLRYQDEKSGAIANNSSLKGVVYQALNLPIIQNFKEFNAASEFQLLLTNDDFANPPMVRKKIIDFMNHWEHCSLHEKHQDHLSVKHYVKQLLGEMSNVRG